MIQTKIFIGLLLLTVIESLLAERLLSHKYQSCLFRGVPNTKMTVKHKYKISSGVCNEVLKVTSKGWFCWLGKSAMEVIVRDSTSYASIEFDSELETITIERDPGKYGCYGKAQVFVRYSCNVYYSKINWIAEQLDFLKGRKWLNKPSYIKIDRYGRIARDASEAQNSKQPIRVKIYQDAHVPSDVKIPNIAEPQRLLLPCYVKRPDYDRIATDVIEAQNAKLPYRVKIYQDANVPNDVRKYEEDFQEYEDIKGSNYVRLSMNAKEPKKILLNNHKS